MVTVIRRLTAPFRPHTDYGSGLNPDCLQRLVTMLLSSRHKTQYRQSGFFTPAPYMVSEPQHNTPFVYKGYLEAIKVGRKVCYRRSEVERLIKLRVQ